MGLFDWFTNKAEKEIEKLNPLFFETWNEFSPHYEESARSSYKTYVEVGIYNENDAETHINSTYEEIKKEIAIIATDPNPIIGLRYTATQMLPQMADLDIIIDQYSEHIQKLITNYEPLAEFMDLIKYESGIDQKEIDNFPDIDLIWLLKTRRFKVGAFITALYFLKFNLNEYPEKNYLQYLFQSYKILHERKIKKALGLESELKPDKLLDGARLASLEALMLSCEIDQHPHYEWVKLMKEQDSMHLVDLLEKAVEERGKNNE